MASERTLAEALAAAQGAMEAPEKTKTAELRGRKTYKYSGIEDLLEVVRPALSAEKIAFTQMPAISEGWVVLHTRVWVGDGQNANAINAFYPLWKLDSPPGHHEQGSAMTYARRYCLESVLGLAGTPDDDGHQAQRGSEKRTRKSGRSNAASTPASGPPQAEAKVENFEEHKRARANPEHHSSYTASARGFFCARLSESGTSYDEVAQACDAKGWSRPSRWLPEKREGLLQAFADGSAWAHLGLDNPNVQQAEGA